MPKKKFGKDTFSYTGANAMLKAMETGECNGICRTDWLRAYKKELTRKSGSKQWTASQKKTISRRIEKILKKTPSKAMTQKHRKNPEPPYPADIFCESIQITGNDGKLYESVPDKNGVCRWKLCNYWWNWNWW